MKERKKTHGMRESLKNAIEPLASTVLAKAEAVVKLKCAGHVCEVCIENYLFAVYCWDVR